MPAQSPQLPAEIHRKSGAREARHPRRQRASEDTASPPARLKKQCAALQGTEDGSGDV